jgi:hypothetical protein
MEGNFRNSFLSNFLLQPLDIWYTALKHGLILWDLISRLLLIHLLFTNLVKFSTLMVNRNSFLSNFLSQPLDIWYTALKHGLILWDLISSLSLIYFLFTDLVTFSTLMVNERKFS